jgi:hypothetical protein
MFHAIMMNINEVQQPLRWIIILYASLNTALRFFFSTRTENKKEEKLREAVSSGYLLQLAS